MRNVLVFDTTLRDGEQSPGANLTPDEKMDIAKQLDRLGVDIIEAGFPAASPGDLKAVREISEIVGQGDGPVIAGLARAITDDVEKCLEAIEPADNSRVHIFLGTSDIHVEEKLDMTRDQILETVVETVSLAREGCDDVEFSPEDSTRADMDFLCEVLSTAVEAGATTLNIADTCGFVTPDEYKERIKYIKDNVKGIEDVKLSVHCHDDLGLATANTLAGIEAGADQIEVTINGLGERAGNAALEEVVMALKTRQDIYDVSTNIDTKELLPTSKMVSEYTGFDVQPNKSIVGENAFAHEAGIHQDGVLKDKRTYEIMDARDVGLEKSQLILGKHSGRHAFRVILEDRGIDLSEEELNEAFEKFKEVTATEKTVTDDEIVQMVEDLKTVKS